MFSRIFLAFFISWVIASVYLENRVLARGIEIKNPVDCISDSADNHFTIIRNYSRLKPFLPSIFKRNSYELKKRPSRILMLLVSRRTKIKINFSNGFDGNIVVKLNGEIVDSVTNYSNRFQIQDGRMLLFNPHTNLTINNPNENNIVEFHIMPMNQYVRFALCNIYDYVNVYIYSRRKEIYISYRNFE